MCVVSMVGDHFHDRWKDKLIPNPHQPFNPGDGTVPYNPIQSPGFVPTYTQPILIGVPQKDFDDLKKEVEIMKALLIKAKLYDEANNEKDCEMEEKVKFLRQIAEAVGVNLDEIFGQSKGTISAEDQQGI